MKKEKYEKNNLNQKIEKSDIFIVLATRNYIECLKNIDSNIENQIRLAREFKKPFFIIIDNKLSKEEKRYIGEYFSKDNIMKRIEANLYSNRDIEKIVKEIKRLAWEATGKDDNVEVLTEDIEGDDSKK